MPDSAPVADALTAGGGALARGAWDDARASFASVLAHGEHPAALEGLSWTYWWQEDVVGCLDARERAYRAYRDTGDRCGAARMALWIGDDHLWYRNSSAVADGWFARARRILADLAEGPEHGWLAVFDAHVALAGGQLAEARRLTAEAQRIGRGHGVIDVEMFAVATEGVVRLQQGEVTEGLRCLDEATAAALGGEYESLAPAAWSCCLLLTACEELRDDERGAQWCHKIIDFSSRVGARLVLGNCRSHYGAILTRRGQWAEAEAELVAALRRLEHGPVPWRIDALARLGELRRRQGRAEEAVAAFEQAGEHGQAQIGLASLRLEHEAEVAAELAEATLLQEPPRSPRRADALELAVRARLAIGGVDAAVAHSAELHAIAESVATGPLIAAARLCEARILAAQGAAEAAAKRYAGAAARFARAGAPLEAALARVELARTLASIGRATAGDEEARRAHEALRELGAAAEAERAARLRAEITARGRTDARGPLTARQIEVLRLAGDGLTEGQIAERLTLSEHTVHRHLANIYSRLGCSSRAAAITLAGNLRLL